MWKHFGMLYYITVRGSTVAQCLASSSHSKKVLGSNMFADWNLSAWSFNEHVWVSSGCFGFLPQPKNIDQLVYVNC